MNGISGERGADIVFLGDLSFGAGYGRSALVRRGLDSAFGNLDALLLRADFVVGNLETALTTRESSPLKDKKRYVHRDDPAAAKALARHGVQAVSLANNHAFDYGAAGLEDTLISLGASGITAIGAGPTGAAARRPFVRDVELSRSTFQLAVVAGKHDTRKYDYHYFAGNGQAGINGWLRRSATAQIRRLRKAQPNAFLVAFPHWGKNYRWRNGRQSRLARTLIRAGADLVVGHGAHCVQEIERVEGRWVVYSIGNSVFHTAGRYRSRPEVLPYSFVARLRVTERDDHQDVTLRLYPILSDNRRTRYRPRFVDDAELEGIRTRLVERIEEPDQLEGMSADADEIGAFLELPVASRPVTT